MDRLEKLVSFFEKNKNMNPFQVLFRGIEREGLRVSPRGELSQRPHPSILGSALTHPHVTTDFSESLMELVTPKFKTLEECSDFLNDIHHFVYDNLEGEFIWCGSMPCVIKGEDSIPVAYYGESNIGKMKRVYRIGLKNRYGSLMEVISGVHYNFSFSDNFWAFLRAFRRELDECPLENEKDFISSSYFCLIRNVHRFGWVIPFFFGASPALCSSFLSNMDKVPSFLEPFDKKGTYFSRESTSLRLSGIGYKNSNQDQLQISYNDVDSYVRGLQTAIKTPYGPWANLGLKDGEGNYKQLNTNLLQIENEYYGSVRPKRIVPSGSSPSLGLKREGVEYIELRSLDINPFSPVGITEEQMRFLDIFLTFCTLKEGNYQTSKENKVYGENFSRVLLEGQNRNLHLDMGGGKLEKISDILNDLFSELDLVAAMLDQSLSEDNRYQGVLQSLRKVINREELSLSEKVLDEMKTNDMSYSELTFKLSKENKSFFINKDLDDERKLYFINESEKSKIEHLKIEREKKVPFDQFVQKYLGG